MWSKIALLILKHRFKFLGFILLVTLWFAYLAKDAEITYDYVKVVPANDPDLVYYNNFKNIFGDDANLFILGIKDSAIYKSTKFNEWKKLEQKIAERNGVIRTFSIGSIYNLIKNTEFNKFEIKPVFTSKQVNQNELDSLLQVVNNLPFYQNYLYNKNNGAMIMVISLDKKILNTKERIVLIEDIVNHSEKFSTSTGIDVHYAGIPYIRSMLGSRVAKELYFLLILSGLITLIFLFYFFRSFYPVIISLLVVAIGVIWSFGTIVLLGFKMTLLTALIPTLIVVIGIPNCIYLINRYHFEYSVYRKKILSLIRIIRKIGMAALLTSVTTAIGFITLYFTNITILSEFGLIAAINIMGSYLVSIILIPIICSFLPSPNERQLKHLGFPLIKSFLNWIEFIVHTKRKIIYTCLTFILIASGYGIYKIQTVAYMLDDIGETGGLKADLNFFETNFSGILPFEIVIETPNSMKGKRLELLHKIEEMERAFSKHEPFSKPISINNFARFTSQSFYNGNPDYYRLPDKQESVFISRYMSNSSKTFGLMRSFIDSSEKNIRISYKIRDIGSNKMDSLIKLIKPKLDFIFKNTGITYHFTGATLIFLKGNTYLTKNLIGSLILALFLIALIIAILFYSVRMMMLTILTNLIPLVITGGLMGYFGIHLKPSTAIIFSIAFGIAVDTAIHFLARYKQIILHRKIGSVANAVSTSISETGRSMISTSIVLFFGFIIFTFSDFGGTIALGFLISLTLLISLFSNLIVLPSLLLSLEIRIKRKDIKAALIDQYDDYYDDHDIDVDLLQVKKLDTEEEELE